MDKLKKLVDALNGATANISTDTAVMFTEKDAEGKTVARYFVKKRPVKQANGIESLEYVARLQE
jgi:hypothetical protein